MFSYDNLENFMRTNFAMMHHHHYSFSDLENMIPWERQIYVNMVSQYIEEENERIKSQKINARNMRR